jgi:hypothetical protein
MMRQCDWTQARGSFSTLGMFTVELPAEKREAHRRVQIPAERGTVCFHAPKPIITINIRLELRLL